MEVIPAIIAGSQAELDAMIEKVRFAGVIQLDVMDGKLVPNKSLQFDMELPEHEYEAHLMVECAVPWIVKFGKLVDTIIVHYEASDADEALRIIKKLGKKAAMAVNPSTNMDAINPYLDELDMVLVMTVEPGQYGAQFVPASIEKIAKLRRNAPEIDIEVDGGITDKTIGLARGAGANRFVSGSYIVKSDQPIESYNKLMETLKNGK